MADITPFRALRYDFQSLDSKVSDRIAPPYDILDQSDKDRLLTRSDRNIVAVDLPHVPPKSLGPPEAYESAAVILDGWTKDGTLVREQAPAFYVYHQVFEHDGRSYTRRAFFTRLRLEPFSTGSVLPHEQTFGGPKEDRLALMKTTRTNLSPVLALYRDPNDEVALAFASSIERPPDAVGTLNNVQNRLWIVSDSAVVNRIVRAFADRKIYIADGHHRYITALNYRDWLAERTKAGLSTDHPANFALLALASMDDAGNLLLPTHRVLTDIPDVSLDQLMQTWKPGCAETSPDQADMTLFCGAGAQTKHVRFTNRAVLASLEPGMSDAWCELDVAYLHRYLIDELFTPSISRGDTPKIRYIKTLHDAESCARNEKGIALICKPTTMSQLRSVSEAGDLMPAKSTYFYPKVVTGLVINPLE